MASHNVVTECHKMAVPLLIFCGREILLGSRSGHLSVVCHTGT